MNTHDLIDAIAVRTGVSRRDADETIQTVREVIACKVGRGGAVQPAGFGSFLVRQRAARAGRILAPGTALKNTVNAP
ncbi:DNA-binding protein [Burkholderia multivorans]|uniref:HU family DNA-binding protein n=1 Tax=Burkholderia ubonensis TaxID=101571 RepID=UPI00075DB59F|nr:HU family DNA-binding protein [Burkholderia ubonensis]AYZ64467.1 DNA-binding protein [Burkholderia multivorans]KVC64867.1 hypothetical protein WI72_07065 [Burkholderia ubonensis]KVD90611.1 hypothetical protein WI90_16430 [Burkholderia ubonensis]VWB06618.1 DNA-binding protein HU-alpha [Burkholderia ubonensis]